MSQRQNAITTVLRVCISNSSEKVVVLLKSLYCIIIVSYYHGKNATFLLLSASDIFTIQRGCKIHTHKEIASVAATNVLDKCTCKLMSRKGGTHYVATEDSVEISGFYVKSSLQNLEVLKLPFWYISDFKNCKNE